MESLRDSETYSIYNQLRKNGIKPSQISIEGKSYTTLENILNSWKKSKKEEEERLELFPTPRHLERVEYIINKAKEEGIIDKDFKIRRIETSQTWKEDVYGIITYLLERYNLRHGLKNYKRNRDSYIEKTWELLKKKLNPNK